MILDLVTLHFPPASAGALSPLTVVILDEEWVGMSSWGFTSLLSGVPNRGSSVGLDFHQDQISPRGLSFVSLRLFCAYTQRLWYHPPFRQPVNKLVIVELVCSELSSACVDPDNSKQLSFCPRRLHKVRNFLTKQSFIRKCWSVGLQTIHFIPGSVDFYQPPGWFQHILPRFSVEWEKMGPWPKDRLARPGSLRMPGFMALWQLPIPHIPGFLPCSR